MKKLIALLPLLLLGACADPGGYSPGAWANYDSSYEWGYSGYSRPYNAAAYAAPAYYPQAYAYGPAYSYGPSYDYGPGYGGGYGPNDYGTRYEDPGYGGY